MLHHRINIYINSENNIFDKALEGLNCPKNTVIDVHYSGNVRDDIERGTCAVVITDHIDTVSGIAEDKPDGCFLVFCGEYGEAERYISEIDEMWNITAFTAAKEVRHRFEWLLERVVARMEAVFYKNAFNNVIDTVPEMLWIMDTKGVYAAVNNTFLKSVNRVKNDVVGRGEAYVWQNRVFREEKHLDYTSLRDPGLRIGTVYMGGSGNESPRQITAYKRTLLDPQGRDFGTLCVCSDAGTYENAGVDLSVIVENMPYPVTIFTSDWKVIRMNSRFRDIVGADEILDFDYKMWKEMSIEPCSERTEDKVRGTASQEFKIQVDCELGYYGINEFEVRDNSGGVSAYLCTITDYTYRRNYENSIAHAANTDMLTGMHNRRYFYTYLNENIRKPLYLLYLDLDCFKAVNDTYGHDVGDAVLVRMSQLINRFFSDSVTARLGGDEFAVINETSTEEDLKQRSDLLEQTVVREFRMYECNLGVSIGIAHSDGSDNGVDMIIHESDANMYIVKKAHHNKL